MAGFVLRHGSPSDHWAWPSPTSTTTRACRSRSEGSGHNPQLAHSGRQPHLVKLALIGRVRASGTSGRCAQTACPAEPVQPRADGLCALLRRLWRAQTDLTSRSLLDQFGGTA